MKTSKMRFLPFIVAASALSLTSCEKDELADMQQETMSANQAQNAGQTNKEGDYIVVLKDNGASSSEQVSSRASALFSKHKQLQAFSVGKQGFTTRLSAQELSELKNNDQVDYIEQDQPIQAYQTTSTASTSSTQQMPWSTSKIGMGDGAATGRTAWIIDSGIQLNHPDLNVDVARSRSFLSTTTSPDDQYGHGTSVAGVIGAKNNTIGSVGVAAGAKVASLRVMDANGAGSVSNVIKALNYVATTGRAGDVVNLSLGASPSTTLDNAVRAVADKGIFVTIAAGNSAANAANYSPARVDYNRVFTVSGMQSNLSFWGRSNWGTPVDYTAPGSGVYTTAKGSSYATCGGTSFASPHVAAVLLLKGTIASQGNVLNDPDGKADRIAKL